MTERTFNALWIAGVALLVTLGGLLVTDYAAGPRESLETTIAAKIYIRDYTTWHTGWRTHQVGKTTIRTPYRYSVYHPEQFRVMAGNDGANYNVSEATWSRATEGEPLILARHVGYWTGWRYAWSLVAINPALEARQASR